METEPRFAARNSDAAAVQQQSRRVGVGMQYVETAVTMAVPDSESPFEESPFGMMANDRNFRTNLAVALVLTALAIVALAAADLYRRRARHERAWAAATAAPAGLAACSSRAAAFWASAQAPLLVTASEALPPLELSREDPPLPITPSTPRIVIRVKL